jgi:hypothetical protein
VDVLFRVADPGGLRSPQRVSTIPIPRREPGGDNPQPRPDRSPKNPPSLVETGTVVKKTARSGTSRAFRWAPGCFGGRGEEKYREHQGPTGGPVTAEKAVSVAGHDIPGDGGRIQEFGSPPSKSLLGV